MILSSATAYSQYAPNIILNTDFKDVYGQTNMSVYIRCDSYVSITNTSSLDRKYTIGTRICRQAKDCIENKSGILVRKGNNFKNTYYTTFQPTFTRPGQKPLECTNFVAGSENASQIKNATAFIS